MLCNKGKISYFCYKINYYSVLQKLILKTFAWSFIIVIYINNYFIYTILILILNEMYLIINKMDNNNIKRKC